MFEPPTINELEDALQFIDADCAHEDWVKVLMGIKNEFGDSAYDIADTWSRSGASYKPDVFKATWKSIKSGGSVTIATVFKFAYDNGYTKTNEPRTPEQEAKAQAEFAERAKKRELEEQAAAELTAKWHELISTLATTLFNDFTIGIKSNQYLNSKKVASFGLKAFRSNLIIVMHDNLTTEIISDGPKIKAFFDRLPEYKDDKPFSFLHIKRSDLAIPLYDANQKIWQLQIITKTAKKLFIKHGKKSGCFYIIGDIDSSEYFAVCEGYATGASIHMASKWPCALAFDEGNLTKVGKLLKERYPDKIFVVCSDDDSKVQTDKSVDELLKKENPGVFQANKTAKAINGILVIPDFSMCVEKVAA